MECLLEYVPEELHEVFAAIVGLTDDFCDLHLNEDYRQLARDMAVEICQDGLPVKKGRPKSWAGGIIHALGWVNFLADPSFEPYMSVGELAERFGISGGTMAFLWLFCSGRGKYRQLDSSQFSGQLAPGALS